MTIIITAKVVTLIPPPVDPDDAPINMNKMVKKVLLKLKFA